MKPAMPFDNQLEIWMILPISQCRYYCIHPITQTGIREKRYLHEVGIYKIWGKIVLNVVNFSIQTGLLKNIR